MNAVISFYIGFLPIKILWFQSVFSNMYFIKLGCSECCDAWFYNSTIHNNVYFNLYCPVSDQLVSDVYMVKYICFKYTTVPDLFLIWAGGKQLMAFGF